MTKLSGTTGQLFAGLAESLARGVSSRSTKGAAGTSTKTADDSSFHDLLHTVSNMAKRALDDQGTDPTAKAASVRPRVAQLNERDASKDEPVHERAEETKSSHKQDPADQSVKTDVQTRLSLPTLVGQELAAVPAVTTQVPQSSNEKKETSTRDASPSAAKREVQGAASATTADAARSAAASSPAALSTVARSGADASGSRPQSVAGAQAAAMPQGSEVQPKAMPAAPGFEAVTANVERTAKSAGRDALPETTKVTVVQQETHLPPVPQFSATQQVANAVVSELKGSPAPTASAAPDLVGAQGNSPDQPVKILTVNLEPPSLGNVTMRLRLVGNEVSVQLAAERKDTSTMLDQQRDQIRDLVQSTGYVADVAPVQHGSLDGFQSGSSQSQLSGQQQQSSQSQGAFGGAGTSSGQSDGGTRQARQEQQPNQETRHDQDVAPHTRRGPVYL